MLGLIANDCWSWGQRSELLGANGYVNEALALNSHVSAPSSCSPLLGCHSLVPLHSKILPPSQI